MNRKRWLPAWLALTLSMLACNYVTRLLTPATPTPETVLPSPTSQSSTSTPQPEIIPSPTVSPTPATLEDIRPILKQLGGQPCEEQPVLTCVTITVPLDHFNPSNQETLQVVFGILPAEGKRYGMFVQAFPGGPGGEGISSAYPNYFDERILEHFDIVYFDQRGVGLSSPLDCPRTHAADSESFLESYDTSGVEGLETIAEQEQAVEDARRFVEECIQEIGIAPEKLAFYGTNQVAKDIEAFRRTIGDEKIWLYGISYGTAVAQTYAAAHLDRLHGLILDGTIDLTLSGEESALAQEKAFERVLLATLEACEEDFNCSEAFEGSALAFYDDFASRISRKPLTYEFPLPSGKKVKRLFTFNQLEFVTAYQMYSRGGRSLFLRALAAAQKGDIIPLARLLYIQATIDPATGEYLGDPTFSDTMFTAVHCTDNAYFSGTPEERIEKVLEAGQASNGTVPRLDGSVYTGLTCAFWPAAPQEPPQIPPLTAPGLPVLVLNATLDPATPFEEGKAVFERLENGYHLYVEGGVHGIFGWGEACPDEAVVSFLVEGKLPARRETVCKWDAPVIYPFVPLLPETLSAFSEPEDIFLAIMDEINRMPEYYYSDYDEEGAFACPKGGSFAFGPSKDGVAYTLNKCVFIKGFEMTGTGGYNPETDVFRLTVQIRGTKNGQLDFSYNWNNNRTTLKGEYGGKRYDR
ncbi:MAG: alpha/beta hydrolase [Anaerolineales bacterium]|nr:alpha/beta hydrolase [Anaerolineales bacterium]